MDWQDGFYDFSEKYKLIHEKANLNLAVLLRIPHSRDFAALSLALPITSPHTMTIPYLPHQQIHP